MSASSSGPRFDFSAFRRLNRGAYELHWRAITVVLWIVASGSLIGVLVVKSSYIHTLRLELGGAAERGPGPTSVPAPALIAWTLALALVVAIALVTGLALFPRRAFRIQSWRTFRRAGNRIVIAGLVVWLVEGGVLLLIHLEIQPARLWLTLSALAWAKVLGLAVVAVYVVVAAFTYVLTPKSIQRLLLQADDRGVEPAQQPEALMPTPATFSQGISVAGGGVRSAALALGALQELECDPGDTVQPAPSWRNATRVSAVSGGAYMAGAWSLARATRTIDAPPASDPPLGESYRTSMSADAWSKDSPEEHHLLTRLGYLLAENPTGQASARKGDIPGVVVTYLAGVALNVTVLYTLWWLVVQPWAWLLKSSLAGCSEGELCAPTRQTVLPVVVYAVATLVAVVVWIGAGWIKAALKQHSWAFRLFDRVYTRGRWPTVGLGALTAGYFVIVLAGPLLVQLLPGAVRSLVDQVQVGAVISGVGSAIAAVQMARSRAARFAPYVGGALFLLTVVLVTVALFHRARIDSTVGWLERLIHFVLPVSDRLPVGFVAWVVVLVVATVVFVLISPEWWSMAAFYRGKLRTAFATYRSHQSDGAIEALAYGNGNAAGTTTEPSVYELDTRTPQRPDGTPLTICATATMSSRRVATHYGVPALGVTFTPDAVRVHVPVNDEGHWLEYECTPQQIERKLYRPSGFRLTTMAAVGMSGAAISPAMGRYRVGPTRTLIALLNARLGVWMPNPKYVSQMGDEHAHDPRRPQHPYRLRELHYPNRRIGYLLKELLGVFDPDDLYLYVTDGGHWENTGLVELLRRGMLNEVVCLDADTKVSTLGQLADAIVLAKVEIGAEILIDLDDLRTTPGQRVRGSDYAKRSVTVGVIRAAGDVGLLWYAKPVLTAGTPADLLAYAETDPSFPTTSTLDQFFHTSQFAAYRDLGRYNARELIEARTKLLEAVELSFTVTQLKAHEATHWSVASLYRLLAERPEDYLALHKALLKPSATAAAPDATGSATDQAEDPAVRAADLLLRSDALAQRGLRRESLSAAEEAIATCRDPATAANGPQLAGALTQKSNRLAGLGRLADARDANAEAIRLYRAAGPSSDTDRIADELARALAVQAMLLSRLSDFTGAVEKADEAEHAYRKLKRPAELAFVLTGRARLLRRLDRLDEAKNAIAKAVGLYAGLCSSADDYTRYATALTLQSAIFSSLGKPAKAKKAHQAAASTLRKARNAEVDP